MLNARICLNCPRCERAVDVEFETWTTTGGETVADALCPRCRLLLAADIVSDELTPTKPHQY